MMRLFGCAHGQGCLFSRPIEFEDLKQMISEFNDADLMAKRGLATVA